MDDKGHGTLKRTKKKSYDWMKHIIETNGFAFRKRMVINSLFFFCIRFHKMTKSLQNAYSLGEQVWLFNT